MSLGAVLNVKLADFYPARTSLNLWWGFFWRTTAFTVLFMLVGSIIVNQALGLWARVDFQSVVRFLLWKQQNPAEWFILSQAAAALFAMLPGMVLAWWMLLSSPVYRTYTLRHTRTGCKTGKPALAHGLCGAAAMGWSTFWRLMVNFAPLYAMLYALQAYQVHLASTDMSDIPGFSLLIFLVMLPTLYLYPLTLHHILKDKHKGWTLEARRHTHKELLAAFLPTEK